MTAAFPSHEPPTTSHGLTMVCPNCNSTDLRRLSLIHAAGSYETRGGILGFLLGDGLLFGGYRGASQSRLSKMAGPPRKGSYLGPAILWLVGFFIVMAFAGRGKLSTPTAIFSMAYLVLLPTLLIGTFVYNLFLRPKKLRDWENKFMCQRCGAVTEIRTSAQAYHL